MKEIAAYILLTLGGNASPTAEQVSSVISSIGGEVDEAKVASLVEELEGKDISQLVAKGKDDLKACGGAVGGGAGVVVAGKEIYIDSFILCVNIFNFMEAATPAAGAAVAAAAPVAEKPKEEEVDVFEGGMDMFGGSGGGGGGGGY
eukprot:gene8266-10591_t